MSRGFLFSIGIVQLIGITFADPGQPGLKPLDAYEPIEMTSRNDTLSVVFASDSLFYPFGKHPEIKAFVKNLGSKAWAKRAPGHAKLKASNQYVAYLGRDSIRVFVGDRVGEFHPEIVEADITGPGLKLKNGIRIGLNGPEVFGKYFESASPEQVRKYRVLELISGLDGIWHFYTFHKGTLSRIEIKSSYVWEQ